MYPVNLAAPSDAERRRSLKFCRGFAPGIAADLGADKMLVTSGTGYATAATTTRREPRGGKHRGAGRNGAGLRHPAGLEVLRHDESNLVHNLETLRKMLDQINLPSVYGMVDTIPMALAGETLADYLNALGKGSFHFPLHRRRAQRASGVGDGVLDMKGYRKGRARLRRLSVAGNHGRTLFHGAVKSVEQSVKQLFSVILSLHPLRNGNQLPIGGDPFGDYINILRSYSKMLYDATRKYDMIKTLGIGITSAINISTFQPPIPGATP